MDILEEYLKKTKGITRSELENIEDAVLNKGVSGVKYAIQVLNDLGSKMDSDKEKFDVDMKSVDTIFRTISARTLNEIATMNTYKNQIRKWRESHSGKDNAESVKSMILHIEQALNKELLTLKMNDAKIRHQKEKSIIMAFYSKNKSEIKKIFDLQDAIVKAKKIVLKNWDN